MGAKSKDVMNGYIDAKKKDYDLVVSELSKQNLLAGYGALRDRTEQTLYISVAGAQADLRLANNDQRIHKSDVEAYKEVLTIKARLDMYEILMDELEAEIQGDVSDFVSTVNGLTGVSEVKVVEE